MKLAASRIKTVEESARLATDLLKEENTIVERWESLGSTLRDDLVHMQQLAKMTWGNTGIYHVAISPLAEEPMSREQYAKTITAIEAKLGLTGLLRIQTYHEKDGHGHLHVCWSLVDMENERLIDTKNDYYKLQEVARVLARDLEDMKDTDMSEVAYETTTRLWSLSEVEQDIGLADKTQ